MKTLGGKVAVITGAGSGIGRALSLACARQGMHLALLDLKPAGLQQTAQLLDPACAPPLLLACDVTDEQAVETAAQAVYARYGGAHLLFNNAGVFTGGPLWQAPVAEWRRQFDVNVMGVVHGLRSFIPRMLAAGEPAHIVNTASVGGLTSPPHYSVYAATKHAVVALSECLHHDLQAERAAIGVSVLCPAFVRTAIADAPAEDLAGATSPAAAEHLAATRKLMEHARLSADDVAGIAIEGVLQDRFYILTHPGSRAGIEWRMRDILQDRAPTNPMRPPSTN
ncbi:SDR family NAD(P)-dependent oxidoreductase [Panacagrimonas sp.]|uniref:SDR family NAD(P)-dependent oxidoreductase n=1 Tax=Panacagrimonas sp. TaxID=2480088 RepID=UPI003B524064